jgi:hypothetical protein
MPKRLILTLPDELAERLSRVAAYYDQDAKALALDILNDQSAMLEDHHHDQACQQIAYLAAVEPAGRA